VNEAPAVPDWAYGLARVLDDALRIPGTRVGIGLDGVLGLLVPALGDALSALVSISLLILAFQMCVPRVVLARMVVNVAVDALIGVVPLLGDLFDFAWHANRKNVELIERYRTAPGTPARPSDYVVVALALGGVLLALALPLALTFLTLTWLGSRLFGG
jgi:hypothetical protein